MESPTQPLIDLEYPFGVWHEIAPPLRSGERSYRPSKKAGVEGPMVVANLNDKLDSFVSDSTNENFRSLRQDIRKAKETESYYQFLEDALDGIELKLAGTSRETKTDTLNLLFEGISNDDRSEKNLRIGKKLVEALYRITVTKKDEMGEDLIQTVNSILERPNSWGNKDVRYLIFRGIFEYQNQEQGKLVAGYMMAKYGVSLFLDNVKQIVYDQSLNEGERKSANSFLLSFWEGIVPIKRGEVILDWNEFYAKIDERYHPMTEEAEGDKRVGLILEYFEKINLDKNATILDIGCGTGWLTERLVNSGYAKAYGLDDNPRYIKEARDRGIRVLEGDFHRLWRVLDRHRVKTPKVEIINGRTIMHFKQSELLQLNSEIVIFDSLDPTTGAAKERLDRFRDKLTDYGFNREWLEGHFFSLLGSIDGGDHLGERLALPESYFKSFFGDSHAVTVIRESNYDGQGTDNLVYVCIGGRSAQKLYGYDIYRKDNLDRFNGIGRGYNVDVAIIQPHKFYNERPYALFGY